ncbi:MAG: hypothetical protein KF770_11620 [Anaerolineae bacterium]|nr:hypothetical protein [Anaerolineae bacterium]
MMIELESLQQELRALPKMERLKLAHWLLDSLVETSSKELPLAAMVDKAEPAQNPLLKWAGMFEGGPVDTAAHDEEILEAEIEQMTGWNDK